MRKVKRLEARVKELEEEIERRKEDVLTMMRQCEKCAKEKDAVISKLKWERDYYKKALETVDDIRDMIEKTLTELKSCTPWEYAQQVVQMVGNGINHLAERYVYFDGRVHSIERMNERMKVHVLKDPQLHNAYADIFDDVQHSNPKVKVQEVELCEKSEDD